MYQDYSCGGVTMYQDYSCEGLQCIRIIVWGLQCVRIIVVGCYNVSGL